MKPTDSANSSGPRGFPLFLAVALGAALSVSNGPAVGVSIGAALAVVSLLTRR